MKELSAFIFGLCAVGAVAVVTVISYRMGWNDCNSQRDLDDSYNRLALKIDMLLHAGSEEGGR